MIGLKRTKAESNSCATPFGRSDPRGIKDCLGVIRWTPHPVIVTIRDNKDYIRVLLYSYYTLNPKPILGGPPKGVVLPTSCDAMLTKDTFLSWFKV